MHTSIKILIALLLLGSFITKCWGQNTFQRYEVGQASILIPDYLFVDSANEFAPKFRINTRVFISKNLSAFTMIYVLEWPRTPDEKISALEIHLDYIKEMRKSSKGLSCASEVTFYKEVGNVKFYVTEISCTIAREKHQNPNYTYSAVVATDKNYYMVNCNTLLEQKDTYFSDFEKVVFSLVER